MIFIFIKKCFVKITRYLNAVKKNFYYLYKYKAMVNVLERNDVIEIKPLFYKRWHHGYAYFLGKRNGEKVFVKVDTKLQLLRNEKVFYDVMDDSISSYLLPLHFYSEARNMQVVCFSYANGSRELSVDLILENPSYLNDIVSILKKMKIKSVIHRDIKLDNFIISDGNLYIIDFTFSFSLSDRPDNFKELDINISEEREILKMLGSKYKVKDFLWNDFVSLKNVVNEIVDNSKLSTEQMSYFEVITHELDSLSEGAYYSQNVHV